MISRQYRTSLCQVYLSTNLFVFCDIQTSLYNLYNYLAKEFTFFIIFMSVPQLHNLSHVTGDSVLNSSTKLEISSLYALYFNFVIPQTLG